MAGIGAVVARWERFHFNPRPSQKELEAIASVVEVDADRLAQMLPPLGVGMQHEPIRLCGACYAETPCHRIEWQYKSVWKCDRHQLKILAKCPNCEALSKYLRCGRMGVVIDVECRLRKWQSYRRAYKYYQKKT